MGCLKERIQKSFEVAGETYTTAAHVQRATAQGLISRLQEVCPAFHPHRILDGGTGHGEVVSQLLTPYPKATYTLNDLSSALLQRARQKFSALANIRFTGGDLESLPFPPQDLLISNMALQWVDNLENTLKHLQSRCQILAFTCPVAGTFSQWEALLAAYDLKDFFRPSPSLQQLTSFCHTLSATPLVLETQSYPLAFPNPRTFMNYLRVLGANVGASPLPAPVGRLKRLLRDTHTHPFATQYTICFAILESHS